MEAKIEQTRVFSVNVGEALSSDGKPITWLKTGLGMIGTTFLRPDQVQPGDIVEVEDYRNRLLEARLVLGSVLHSSPFSK